MAGKLNEAVVVSKAESAYTIMLTSLLRLQAQGWEKGLSRIRFAGRRRLSKIISLASIVCPVACSN